MKVLKSAGGPHEVLYVCEGCGCVTDQIEDIFEFNGIEMCEECVDTYEYLSPLMIVGSSQFLNKF